MDVIVVVGALGLIGALAWFFFGPREASHAVIRGGVQELTVVQSRADVRQAFADEKVDLLVGVRDQRVDHTERHKA